jgi:hypothetical protein
MLGISRTERCGDEEASIVVGMKLARRRAALKFVMNDRQRPTDARLNYQQMKYEHVGRPSTVT